MDFESILLIIIGLTIFETVSSLDNAVINAQVLATMSQRARRWFLTYGLLIAVFLIRGVLPFFIIWITNPALGPLTALNALMSSDPHVKESIEASAPILLIGGGTFLLFLFFHWLFMEPKQFGLFAERFIQSKGIWFYAVVSVLLCLIIWFALKVQPVMAFSAVIGAAVFFITNGFKVNAERAEKSLLNSNVQSDLKKLLYLEVIDATFSIDGVLGAFAFTLSVMLIVIGNGIGAYVVRQITIKSIDTLQKYKYLKNGAMYSIFTLACVMLMDSFGYPIPSWLTPILTIGIVSYFFFKSKKSYISA
jgi:uncharacterized protein